MKGYNEGVIPCQCSLRVFGGPIDLMGVRIARMLGPRGRRPDTRDHTDTRRIALSTILHLHTAEKYRYTVRFIRD